MRNTPVSEDRNVRLTLTLPEALADHYAALAEGKKLTPHQLILKTLAAAKDIDFDTRPLIVHAACRRDMEALAETTIEDGPELLALLKNLVRIDMGDVHLFLTEHQMEKFHEYASFFDEDMKDYMESRLNDAVNQLLGEW